MLNSVVSPETNSLKKLITQLKNKNLNYSDYIYNLIRRFEEIESKIFSFIDPLNEIIKRLKESIDEYNVNCSYSDKPLYKIPVGIKDLYSVKGFQTQAGSKLPAHLFEIEEGTVVKNLLKAGALIVGKTVTTEFAYFAAGPTRNPHNIQHTPGGSSSGSAAAVSAGLVPLAFGTQTIGSIIRPAAFCGVVGFKPSQFRIPTDGIIPLSPSLDQVGFFTSDVESVILVSSVLFNLKKSDKDFYRLCIPAGKYLQKANREVLKLFDDFIKYLKTNKVEIIEIDILDNIDEIKERHLRLLSAEAAEAHKNWFGNYKNLYHHRTIELIETGKNVEKKEIEEIKIFRENFKKELLDFFETNNIDAFITPSTAELPPYGLDYTGDPIMSVPWTFAGLPAINVPAVYSKNNLPFGIQIVGKQFDDEAVLNIAKILEEQNKSGLGF